VPPPEWFNKTEEQGCCWLNTSLTFTSTEQTDLKRHLAFWKPIIEAIFQVMIDSKKELVQSKAKDKAGLVFVMWGGHAQKLKKAIEKMANGSGVQVKFVEAPHPAVEQCVVLFPFFPLTTPPFRLDEPTKLAVFRIF
jgi:uracil DNA glycosylase